MIAIAIQHDNFVEVYNERNQQIFCRIGKLQGYTATTVAVKERSGHITVWDDKGKWVCSRCAR